MFFRLSVLTLHFLLAVLLVDYSDGYVDMTTTPLASGTNVVRATIAKLDHAFDGVEAPKFWSIEHSTFMRTLAYVETSDGEASGAFASQLVGGIWRMDIDTFRNAKAAIRPALQSQVEQVLSVNWISDVSFARISEPLFSAIAARIVLHSSQNRSNSICRNIPTIDSSVIEMAKFWYTCFRLNTGEIDVDSIMMFSRKYNDLQGQSNDNCIVSTDLAFVLDSSGSVGEENWEIVKLYVGNVTDTVDASGDHRVALITYADFAQIDLDFTSDSVAISNAIRTLPFHDTFTNTADGLCHLLLLNWREEILRIAILMTDGQSNRMASRCGDRTGDFDTLTAAETVRSDLEARSRSITTLVIGVTDNVNEEELQAISSTGRYDELTSFNNAEQLSTIRQEQTYRICHTATNRAELDDYLQLDDFTNGSNARYQYEINTEEGITIRLCVEAGRVIVYASFTIPNPNSALNHFTLDAIFHNLNCQDVYIDPGEVSSIDPGSDRRKKRQDSTVEQFLFVSVEGIASSSRFTLETTTGNTTQSTVSCQLVPNPCGLDEHIVCTDDAIGYSCSCVPGYIYNAQEADCNDIDECQIYPPPCGQFGICSNTNGSFECTCKAGYKEVVSGTTTKCIINQNTELRFIITVACGAGGGVIALIVVLAALISGYKAMTAKKNSKYHQRDDRQRPADPNLNFLSNDDKENLVSADTLANVAS